MTLNVLALTVDFLICGLVVACIVIGARRGLVKSLAGLAIVVLALWGASFCAKQLTQPISDWLQPMVEQHMVQKLLPDNPEEYSNLPEMVQEIIEQSQETGHEAISAAVRELLTTIVHTAVYLVSFLLLLLLLWLISAPLKLMAKLPGISTLNRVCGGVLGLVTGILLAAVLLWAAAHFGWLTEETLEEGYLAKYFIGGRWMELLTSL